MAARTARPTRPTATGNKSNATTKAQQSDFWQSLRTFIHSQQCQLIVGILLLFIALMLLISYISFFFTGANDMSIIQESATRSTLRESITNALGLPGAVVASWLIDSLFGVLIVLPILLIGIYALRILFIFPLKAWKLFFCMLFCMVWGSPWTSGAIVFLLSFPILMGAAGASFVACRRGACVVFLAVGG